MLVPNLRHLQLWIAFVYGKHPEDKACMLESWSRSKHTTYWTEQNHYMNAFNFFNNVFYCSSQMSNNMINCTCNRLLSFFLSFFLISRTSGSWEQVDTDRCCNLHWETCLGFISGHCCKWLWQPAHKLCLPPVPNTLMKPDNIWTNEMGSSLLCSTHKFGEHLNIWPNLRGELCVVFWKLWFEVLYH